MAYKSRLIFLLIFILFNIHSYALSVQEQVEILTAHNKVRNKLNLPNLKWSKSLEYKATNWVNTLSVKYECKMFHSHMPNLGENLYWAGPLSYSNGKKEIQPIRPFDVVSAWSSEEPYYDYNANRCISGKVCGHYTQLIWKDTTEVGCAKVICYDKSQIWSCNYNPPGNYINQKPY
ncbi:MAG: CAP domain-containing protein [Sulfurovaceae bacterium]|nr:CAP domain-containing protein [Sulfurovaceae bacterium]